MTEKAAGADVGQVAALLDLTPRRIQQLAKDGIIPKAVGGRYNLPVCVRGYVGFLQKSLTSAQAKAMQPATLDLQHQRSRKTAAEAELAEIDVAKARGEVVSVADYEAALARVLDRLTARLRAMPVRLAHLGPEAEAAAEAEAERIVVELAAFDEDVVDEPEQKAAA